jgi:hypothetical protein
MQHATYLLDTVLCPGSNEGVPSPFFLAGAVLRKGNSNGPLQVSRWMENVDCFRLAGVWKTRMSWRIPRIHGQFPTGVQRRFFAVGRHGVVMMCGVKQEIANI